MYAREFRDGAKDGLEALEPLDPDKITSFGDLLEAMGKTAFGGRHVGKAFDVLWAMIEDPDCHVVLTLSGAMTIAKMGKIISDDDRSRYGARYRLDRSVDRPWSERVGR